MSHFVGKILPTNQDVVERFYYHLIFKRYSVKKAMSATYDEIIAVWKWLRKVQLRAILVA